MSMVTDDLKDDAEWLHKVANEVKELPIHEWPLGVVESVERLRRIAKDQEMYASLMHSTSLLLEQRVEEAMDVYVRSILDDNNGPDPEDVQILTLWLIVRALRSGSSKALLGQGLAGIGAGTLGSFIGDVMKSNTKGKAPVDPEDK